MTDAWLSWSSGKDAAFALHRLQCTGEVTVRGVLTTVSAETDRVTMHGVRAELLDRQTAALGLPAIRVALPDPCSDAVYAERMGRASREIAECGIDHIVFGDLFLADVRAYREAQLARAGMTGVFPLWQRDTREMARAIIACGIEAYVVCLDPKRLDRRLAGRRFDAAFLDRLPDEVDPCGENGEFHTVVTAGPMFDAPIAIEIGETTERGGFVFTDIVPR